jgi:lipopolysaccharide export system protein LptA
MMFFLFTSTGFSEEKKKIEGPIVITSQRLTSDNKAGKAVFEESVVAQTTEMILYADRMIVLYDEEQGDVTKIDAEGNVKVVKDDKVITSQKASYFADTENVVFYGDPRAIEGDNVVTGSTMTYLMAEDRFLVENSKVFLKNTKKE